VFLFDLLPVSETFWYLRKSNPSTTHLSSTSNKLLLTYNTSYHQQSINDKTYFRWHTFLVRNGSRKQYTGDMYGANCRYMKYTFIISRWLNYYLDCNKISMPFLDVNSFVFRRNPTIYSSLCKWYDVIVAGMGSNGP
jgi:hypothetical protein